jgi:hypothetical protein
MNPLIVLAVGDLSTQELQPVRALVDILAERGSDVHYAADLSPKRLSDGCGDWFANLVLVCQHWPDEFSEPDVRRLLTRHPLARIVCCYSPWCESDGRTRTTWPLAVRVPIRCAVERIDRELEVLGDKRAPLPLTASRDEIFRFDATPTSAD